jgi:hypothetical protein
MLFSTSHLQLLLFSFLLLNTIFPVGVTRAIEIEKRRFLLGYTDESDLALIRDAGGEGFKKGLRRASGGHRQLYFTVL